MLTLLNLNPTGLFCYAQHDTIELDNQGLTLLEGINKDRSSDSNGAGKTSVFNSITQILFDRNPSGCSGESVVNKTYGRYCAKLEFLDGDGVRWRIIYTRKWKKQDKYPSSEYGQPSEWHNLGYRYTGTDVYLERWDGHLWKDERTTNDAGEARLEMKATRKKILDIIQLSYEQFLSVAYLAQQQSLKFVTGTHKDRLQVLSELCDLSIWDERGQKAKNKIQIYEAEIGRMEATIEGAKQVGGQLKEPDPDYVNTLNTNLVSIQNKISLIDSALDASYKALDHHRTNIESLRQYSVDTLATIRGLVLSKEECRERLNACAKMANDKYHEIRSRPRPIIAYNNDSTTSELRGQIQIKKMDLEQLIGASGQCPRCRSYVSTDHLLRQRELILMEISEIENKISILNKETEEAVKSWEQDVLKELDIVSEKTSNEKHSIEAEIQIIQDAIDVSNETLKSIKVQESQIGPDPNIEINTLMRNRMNMLSAKNVTQLEINALHTQNTQWREYQDIVSTTNTKLTTRKVDLQYMKVIEKYFGDRGIKSHKLGVLLSMLNQLVQNYMDILTDDSVNVWVTPFKSNSDGGISTDIQIMVREGQKEGVPFDLYSGGERQQMVLAFTGAFWQLATQQGSGVNILCLDEIFGPLDENAGSAVFNFLDKMRSNGKSSIFVVTHNTNIKHLMNWDQKWVITKSGHVSTLTKNNS